MLLAGLVLLAMASFLHAYVAVGLKLSPMERPAILTARPLLMQGGRVALYIGGTALLFKVGVVYGVASAPINWLVAPLLTVPILKRTIYAP